MARELIDEAVAELDGEHDYLVARGYAEKKAAGLAKVPPDAQYRRLAAALARRGFNASVVAQVTREVLAEAGLSASAIDALIVQGAAKAASPL